MRDPKRIPEFLRRLEDAWSAFPDWRFGQLVMNFLSWLGRDPFYIEDDKLAELIDAFVKETCGDPHEDKEFI